VKKKEKKEKKRAKEEAQKDGGGPPAPAVGIPTPPQGPVFPAEGAKCEGCFNGQWFAAEIYKAEGEVFSVRWAQDGTLTHNVPLRLVRAVPASEPKKEVTPYDPSSVQAVD